MTVREKVISDLKKLSDEQLRRVEIFIERYLLESYKSYLSLALADDPILNIGKNPVEVGVADASENLDHYLYLS